MTAPAAAGLILAAGASTRFGTDKLAAVVRGRTMLQHVVDAAADAGLRPVVVVIARQRTELDLRGARPVLNPEPARGLSSSLAVGLAALEQEHGVERVLVLLGDQPLVAQTAIGRLLAAARDPSRPITVPRYQDGLAGNPVLIDRAAWPLATALGGDRGMSQLFETRDDLVRYVEVAGVNPDVDTPADLARLR
ncbi:MAG TPA: nucleotidyltransferase family protein [Candidatus Limnocylindrales bacterium]|nr:nucleotidyltransferase family protein [Candidatus Limnocylindrales bacterium]